MSKNLILVIVSILLQISCSKMSENVGQSVVKDGNLVSKSKDLSISIYNKIVAPASNNTANNLLGCYKDPIFGNVDASFVVQPMVAFG